MNKAELEVFTKKIDAFMAVKRPTRADLDAAVPEWKRLVQELSPTIVQIGLTGKLNEQESEDYLKVWLLLVNYYPVGFFPPGRIVEAPPGHDKLR